jgi:thiol-disulfide isomerase/thioredoxin
MVMIGCLVLAGCGTFAKQPTGKPPAAPSGDPRMPWPPPATPPGPASAGNLPSATPASASGILAGQILDGFNRPPPAVAHIQVVMTEDEAAPIEVAADDQGYFTIQGVQAGKSYRLIARSKYGDKLLAGTTFATPPNPRVIIRIGEENTASDTPPPPGPPVMPKGKARASADAGPPWSPLGPRPAGLGAPIAEEPSTPTLSAPVPPPTPAIRPEDIARGELARNDPPTASIPGPGRWQPADTVSEPAQPPAPPGPAPVPSCVLVGRQLHNLALHDLNGQPWEFRQHRAKLTLIDFWGTWCVHCMNGIHHLRIFQERYGPYGLQVVGIAHENAPPQVAADNVRRVANRLHINYQLLLGGDRLTCPVLSQFQVASWPTGVLLDESGRILWRSSNGMTQQALAELDAIIKQQLSMR